MQPATTAVTLSVCVALVSNSPPHLEWYNLNAANYTNTHHLPETYVTMPEIPKLEMIVEIKSPTSMNWNRKYNCMFLLSSCKKHLYFHRKFTCNDAAALLSHVSPEDPDVCLLQVLMLAWNHSWHIKDVSSRVMWENRDCHCQCFYKMVLWHCNVNFLSLKTFSSYQFHSRGWRLEGPVRYCGFTFLY